MNRNLLEIHLGFSKSSKNFKLTFLLSLEIFPSLIFCLIMLSFIKVLFIMLNYTPDVPSYEIYALFHIFIVNVALVVSRILKWKQGWVEKVVEHFHMWVRNSLWACLSLFNIWLLLIGKRIQENSICNVVRGNRLPTEGRLAKRAEPNG